MLETSGQAGSERGAESLAVQSARTLTKVFAAAQAVIALALAALAWHAIASNRRFHRETGLQVRIERLGGTFRQLAERLSTCTRMAATTGDARWEINYRELEPGAGRNLREIAASAGDPAVSEAAGRAARAHDDILRIEANVLDLVRQHRLEAARVLLADGQFDRSESALALQLDALGVALDLARRSHQAGEDRRVGVVLGLSAALLSLLGFCWVAGVRTMKRRDAVLLNGQESLRRQAAELEALNARLDRKVSERTAQLAENESRYRALVESAGDIIYWADSNGRFTLANSAALRTLGRREEEVLGRTFTTFVHPCQREEVEAFYLRQWRERLPTTYLEFMAVTSDDRTVWLGQNVQVLSDSEHGASFQAIARDVTDRKQAELKLAASEEKFRSIVESTTEWIWTIDGDGRLVYSNPAVREVLGYSPHELLGRGVLDLLHPEDREAVAAAISGRLAARTGWSQHLLRWRHQNGSFRFLEGSAVAILDDAGTVAGWRGVDHDVTESRRLQEDLQVATAAAEAASRAKSEFLANMSHEIRTPMNGIIGMVELLLGTSVSPEQRDYLELVRNSADRLLEVINDILDFSRVEARRLELDARPFFLRECVAQTVGALAVSADAKGLELSFRVAAGLPDHLVGDDGRLRQILVNLIGNAIKFTEQGEVAVEFQQEWQRDGKVGLHVIVRDTGVGVAPDRQEAIFSPFTQGDGTTRRRFGGTGLGLSISSRLVGLMEGRIWVESELGRGSAFHFTACFGTADGDALAPPLANLASLQGTPILVVDDQPTNRRLLEEMLRRWGFAPASAAGGEEALAALRDARREERSYRLVVLDVQMPVVDGFEVVRRMREDPALAPITVMMLSSGGRADEAARCRELGAVPYVVKPVDPSRLLTTIMTALGSPVGEASRRDPLPPSRGRPLRILVAEDNATNQRLVRAILEKHGHQVVLARDGREAVAAAHRGGLDLALVDVQMPELDGFQATAAIRAAETGTTRHLPIVALTAHALKGDREACLAAGMDDYLAKPIHTAELLATIDRVGSRQEPAPARHPRPPFDPEQVLARVEGDQALLSELVDIFRTEIPGLLATLERALEADDQRAVQDAAHAIKGCVGTIGGRVAADAALAIEDLGRAGNLKEAGAGFEALAQEVARLEGGLVRMRESARACDGA